MLGQIHQGNTMFRHAGIQCTGIAFFALIFSKLYMPSTWHSDTLDHVVISGNRLFDGIVDNVNPQPLLHSELPHDVNVMGQHMQTSIEYETFGIVGQTGNVDANSVSLPEGIANSNVHSNFLLMTFAQTTIALILEDDNLYLFDSHSRDVEGQVHVNGASVLLKFPDIVSLITYLESMYGSKQFQITAFSISKTKKQANEKEDETRLKFCSKRNTFKRKHVQSVVEHNYCLKDKSVRKKRSSVRKLNSTDVNFVSLLSENIELDLSVTTDIYNEDANLSIALNVTVQSNDSCKKQQSTNICKEYTDYIRHRPSASCTSCKKFLFNEEVHYLKCETTIMSALNVTIDSKLCCFCKSKLKQDIIPILNLNANSLEPGIIPDILKGLSIMEKRLISRIHVFTNVVVLPGGQLAQKGLCIDFPVDMIHIAKTLPYNKHDVNMITVQYEPMSGSEETPITSAHIVRKSCLIACLQWLLQFNKCYADIIVNETLLATFPELDSQSGIPVDEVTVIPVNYSTPESDLLQYIQSGIPTYKLPRCSSSPVFAFNKTDGEEMTFPHLYPYGRNGFNTLRKYKLTASQYFHHRLYFNDGRFRKNITYLLHALNYFEQQRLRSDVSIHMRIRKKHTSASGVSSSHHLRAENITNISQNPDILENSYMFMKNIRGTVAYWKDTLLNLLSVFKSIGPPTLFVTLSADDMHWPELIMSLNNCSYEDALKVKNASRLVRNDPLMTAIHFERRFKALYKYVLCGPTQPLGKIQNYFGRVEFQNRGSPHLHLFFWIEGMNDISSMCNDDIVTYIDKTISTTVPSEMENKELHILVPKLQTHRHTQTCQRVLGRCRFGFPFKPTSKTHLLTNIDVASTKQKSRFYETARTNGDGYINAYNAVILQHFKSNMDIQLIGNAESAAYYVCAYLCKAEPDDFKQAFSQVLHVLKETNPPPSLQARLFKIGNCVLKTRCLGAQEAAYRLSNLKMIHSSFTILRLNTKPPPKRYRLLKKKEERDILPPNSTDIFENNLHDYYMSRPRLFDDMPFYEFSVWYTKCNTQTSHCTGRNSLPRYKLCEPFSDITIRKRRKPTIIRTCKQSITSDDYFYGLLLMYLPHRSELELLQSCNEPNVSYNSAKEAFIAKQLQLRTTNVASFAIVDEIERAVRNLRLATRELANIVCPQTSQLNDNITGNYTQADVSFPHNVDIPDYNFETMTHDNNDSLNLHSLEVCTLSEEELHKMISQLTRSQLNVFEHMRKNITKYKQCKTPLRYFITGGAGVGKSFLIKVLIEWLRYHTASFVGNDPVAICAPTGTAARNILGTTLHHTLCLPVQHGREAEYMEPKGTTLKKLRQRFQHVHTILIDEISMVSAKMLQFIHRRLTSITSNDSFFGNLNIIIVGDLLQLKPIRGQYIFKDITLWSLFSPFFLDQNVRQNDDTIFASLLNRARVGMLTDEDKCLLKTRLIIPMPCQPCNIIHIFPTRKQVKAHNERMQSLLTENIVTIHAIHYFANTNISKSHTVTPDLIPTDERCAGGIPILLRISKGTRIMLIRNIYTVQGLVNGAMGYVSSIEYNFESNVPSLVYVKFDDNTIGKQFQSSSHENAIPIEAIEQEFLYKGRSIVRQQFPLMPCWGCTIHKLQGASLDMAAMSLGSNVFERGMSYVALSRVRSINGLYLLAFSPDKVQPSEAALQEYERLREKSNIN